MLQHRHLLAGAVLLALGCAQAHAQNISLLRAGEVTTGQITNRSPVESDGTGYVLYRYRGTPGERILVNLKSVDFDAYLSVGTDNTGPNCDDCRRNDDGGEGTDSRLRYTVPANGELQIRAGMVEPGKHGRFSVEVSPLPPSAPITPQTLDIGRETQGQLGLDSARLDDDRPFQLWTVQGQPGQTLVLRMNTDALDPLLEYGQWHNGQFDKQTEDDDGGRGLNARLTITLDAQGRGAIRATTVSDEAEGSYTISAIPPQPPRPVRVREIGIGDSLQGKLDANSNANEDDEAYFDVYRIKGRPGQRLTARLDSDDFDALLRWGVFDGNEFIRDAEDDDGGGGNNARLTVTLDADGIGRLQVTSLSGSEGRYTLSVVNAPRGR